MQKAAEGKRVSKAPVASAWDKCKGCYPIIGLGSIERAREAIDALHVKLTGRVLRILKKFIGEESCNGNEYVIYETRENFETIPQIPSPQASIIRYT